MVYFGDFSLDNQWKPTDNTGVVTTTSTTTTITIISNNIEKKRENYSNLKTCCH